MAAMVTTLTWMAGGGVDGWYSNSIALLLYWSGTLSPSHTLTHTHASIAKITSLFLQSQSHSCAFIPPLHLKRSVACKEQHTALDWIIWQPNYSCANTFTLCTCMHLHSHRRLSRTQCMHDPVSARCIAGYGLCSSRSPLLVFCLFTSLVASSLSFSLSAATVKPSILCSHCGRDCVE